MTSCYTVLFVRGLLLIPNGASSELSSPHTSWIGERVIGRVGGVGVFYLGAPSVTDKKARLGMYKKVVVVRVKTLAMLV